MPIALNELLRATSRTFYLTMRVLPRAVRPPISLAYLLARTADTIADTGLVATESRLRALDDLRQRILGTAKARLDFGTLAQSQALPAEKILLERCEESLALLDQSAEDERQRIREVLDIIISGQELDLKRFGTASAERMAALETEADLDDYTYRVAGCVGEFWTRICRARLFPKAALDEPVLFDRAVRFGKGLQMVNIFRDLPRDLRQGRCYVPRQSLAQLGLAPADLLSSDNQVKFRPLYDRYLLQAEAHLQAGWDYTNSLPRNEFRLRLACAWPVLIGAKTLQKMRRENMLDPDRRIKISRAEVRALICRSIVLYPLASAWQKQYANEVASIRDFP